MAPSGNRWTLDGESLSILLAALAPDREAASRRYEALRRRLIDVFAWERSEAPEDAADEALNRLARRLASGVAIEDQNIERYAFGIARYVMLEEARGRRARDAALADLRVLQDKPEEPVLLRRVERCLEALPRDQRDLILRYYSENRDRLATALGISVNALRNRALRIRARLSECAMRLDRDE